MLWKRNRRNKMRGAFTLLEIILALIISGVFFFGIPIVIRTVYTISRHTDVSFNNYQVLSTISLLQSLMPQTKEINVLSDKEFQITLYNGCLIEGIYAKDSKLLRIGSMCPSDVSSKVDIRRTLKVDDFFVESQNNGMVITMRTGEDAYKYFLIPI